MHSHFCYLCQAEWNCFDCCQYDEEECKEYYLPCTEHHPLWDRWGESTEGNDGFLDNSGPDIEEVFNSIGIK